MLVSAIYQLVSAIGTHMSPHSWASPPASHPSKSSQSTTESSELPESHRKFPPVLHMVYVFPCYSLSSLVIYLYIVSMVYICQSQSPSLSHQPTFLLGVHMFVLYVFLYFCIVNKIIYTSFFRVHTWVNISYLFLSFWLSSLSVTKRWYFAFFLYTT